MLRKNRLIPGFFLTLGFCVASCSGPMHITSMKFPSTPVVSTVDSVALVVDPYVSLRDQPGEAGISVAHARRGEIFVVQGKKIISSGKVSSIWVHLEKGWIPESAVRLYQNREKASLAAKDLE